MNMSNHFGRRWTTAVAAFGMAIVLSAGSLSAQAPTGPDTSSSTTEDSTGKVTAVSPDASISVTSRRGPFTYRLSPDLHVIGPDNKPLKISEVEKGDKVTVYYYLRNGAPTAARVVVLERAGRKASKDK